MFLPGIIALLLLNSFVYALPAGDIDSSSDVSPVPWSAEPLSIERISELAARSPNIHQDPYNITDVAAYERLYKRSTGCDPIGCFDGAFFSVIFHYNGANGVYLYGAVCTHYILQHYVPKTLTYPRPGPRT
jgi:hypothetical protein